MTTIVDNNARLQYLQAMGITVWQARFNHAIPTPTDIIEKNALEIAPPIITAPLINTLEINNSLENNNNSWLQLENDVVNCQQCALCQTRTQTVFGTGNKNARWLIIGEAPGEQEDAQGKPFVGVAGQLLTEMLRAMQLDRENDVFITNILKCRPPENRDPHVNEIKHCNNYLMRQQELIKPQLILAVGRIAAQTLLQTSEPLSQLRGKIHYLQQTPLVVVYHPAYLLRSLIEKRKAWQDLQFALHTMEGLINE